MLEFALSALVVIIFIYAWADIFSIVFAYYHMESVRRIDFGCFCIYKRKIPFFTAKEVWCKDVSGEEAVYLTATLNAIASNKGIQGITSPWYYFRFEE
jgi:hypothetical protein